MQLFSTSEGIVRSTASGHVVVETDLADVHEAVVTGRLGEVCAAPPCGVVTLEDLAVHVPVRPTRVIMVGLNYHAHVQETGAQRTNAPIFAVRKADRALAAPGADITLPSAAPEAIDYEGEIAVVIGAHADLLDVQDAWSVVAGVTASNDVSARDLQRAGIAAGDLAAGKLLAGFKPLGPGLITVDEVRLGPVSLDVRVNGESRQHANSAEMVFGIAELISFISAHTPLQPGDVLLTGSPPGVGFVGGRYLRDGDIVDVTVGSLPPLRNRFRADGSCRTSPSRAHVRTR